MKANKPGLCPEFFGLQKWAEVVAFSETEEGEDIRTFVQLVEQHGEKKLWAAVSGAHEKEEGADIILSTAHKAKGREWESVRLAPDFVSSRLNGVDPNAEAEVRLFYVAMTRAKDHLIVEPEMLGTFTSGIWKTRRPEPRTSQAPSVPVQPSRSRSPQVPIFVREEVPAALRQQVRGSQSMSPPPLPRQSIPPNGSRPLPLPSKPAAIVPSNAQDKHRRWWQFW